MKKLIVIVLLIIVTWWLWRRYGSAPDERIASRLDQLCAITRDHVGTPSAGVDRLFAKLDASTADTLRDLGALVVEVQRIEDPAQHAARARRANRVMRAPLEECAADIDRFLDAVSGDAEASDKLARGVERLDRTLNLLFGNSLPTRLDPRALLRR